MPQMRHAHVLQDGQKREIFKLSEMFGESAHHRTGGEMPRVRCTYAPHEEQGGQDLLQLFELSPVQIYELGNAYGREMPQVRQVPFQKRETDPLFFLRFCKGRSRRTKTRSRCGRAGSCGRRIKCPLAGSRKSADVE